MSFVTMAQNSFDINGYWANELIPNAKINSLEFQQSNFTGVRDWLFSVTYSSEFSNKSSSYLYQISAYKNFNNHLIFLRYTPGLQKEFLFSTGQTILLSDSNSQSLKADYLYKELFGFGYSYSLSENFNAGFSLRFFNQDFTQEVIKPVFSDTNYLVIETEKDEIDLWKADLSFAYRFGSNLSIYLSSINLLSSESKPMYDYNRNYLLKKERGYTIGFSLRPFNSTAFNFNYESDKSFSTSINQVIKLNFGTFGFSLSAYHDKYQNPFINSIAPSIIYSTSLFDIVLSAVKYSEERRQVSSFDKFSENGIKNILHNQFSFDRVNLSVNFKLNTKIEQRIKIIDVDIRKDIFPALNEEYLDEPFASAKVVNLTDEIQIVKPAVKIIGLNKDAIQIGSYQIAAFDTVEIPIYAFVPEYSEISKTQLSYAEIFIYSASEQADDQTQKPVLLNNMNSWDGQVKNLRYFIKHDLSNSQTYSRQIISSHKSELDTLPIALSDFYRAKLIFNSFIKNMTYISDPRIKWDFVQYPSETLELKGGDCDDLSVLYSALLESIGIETALVDYRARNDIRHVNVLLNTKLSPQQAFLITENDTKYFIRKNQFGIDEVWITIETTSLTDFDTAWNLGSEIFNDEALNKMGLLNGNVQIIDVN